MSAETTIYCGDARKVLRWYLKDESVDCCVTSPPYWGLRDYGVFGQIGLENTPQAYVHNLVSVFREVRRILRPKGTLWLNLGDCYASTGGAGWQGKHGARADRTKTQRNIKKNTALNGLKPKDLVGIPWRVAFALQADGWYLRQDIIWHKPNVMPESVRDRCTKAHEYIFLFSKSQKYYYDHEAIKEKTAPGCKPAGNAKARNLNKGRIREEGWAFDPARSVPEYRNRRSVWTVSTKPFRGAHFATFPIDLVEPCVLAGSPPEGVVLDPFLGAGTTAIAAKKNNRSCVGIELNREYAEIAMKRLNGNFKKGSSQ